MDLTLDLTIRQARRDDVPTIVRLLAEGSLSAQREHEQEPLPTTYYAAYDAIAADPRSELIVVELHGVIVGTLHLNLLTNLTYQGGTRAQTEGVRVDQRFRNQGIGRYMVAWALERAKERGCHMMQLTTNVQRSAAQRFYTKLGFVPSHIGLKLDLTQTESPHSLTGDVKQPQ